MSFDAAEPGTPAEAWRAWRDALPSLDLGPLARLVVAVAHPDDETLMAGGLIATAAARDVPVAVVVASSGGASHPGSPTWSQERLAAAREEEVRAAVALLAPAADLHLLRLPDGALGAHGDAIAERLAGLLGAGDTVVSTWRDDGHPDHAAVADAAARAAEVTGAQHLEAPVWGWHWGDPARPPFPRAARLDLAPAAARAKRAAMAVHATQVLPLSDAPGDEVLLTAGVLEHFAQDDEVLLLAPGARPVDFDAMYTAADDPWGFADRWYERRKRAVLLAALPRERYRRVLEIGCSTGITTAALAARADALVAVDVAASAVRQASERLRDAASVRIEQRALPAGWPDEWSADPFDLIVLSETGFYLAGPALEELADRCRAALTPGGVLVSCHWRPQVLGLDRGGDAVNRVVAARLGARRLVSHVEDDFALEVLQTEPSASVAQAEGLR